MTLGFVIGAGGALSSVLADIVRDEVSNYWLHHAFSGFIVFSWIAMVTGTAVMFFGIVLNLTTIFRRKDGTDV